MTYWMFQTEPATWSWDEQAKTGMMGAPWDGVRNALSNKFMKDMKKGEMGFFYHGGDEKRIIGIVKVIREWQADEVDASGKFGMVDVIALIRLINPVALTMVKADGRLSDMVLLTDPKLPVHPVTLAHWDIICEHGGMSRVPHIGQM